MFKNLKLTITGESHTPEMTVTVDGLGQGFHIDRDRLNNFMKRRAAENSAFSTSRHEADGISFSAGAENDITTGEPLTVTVKNSDVKPSDYDKTDTVPRPGHADYTQYIKYGKVPSGGGKASGRMTVLLCAAGGIAIQILEEKGIFIGALAESVAGILDRRFDPCTVCRNDFSAVAENSLPVLDPSAGERMLDALDAIKKDGDTAGGIIECAVVGLPAGIGGELFDGLEGRLASSAFAIPAVKGVEFGIGFAASDIRGSENNDPYYTDGEHIFTKTNNCGGILGGISNGMPLIFRAAVKPIPSIGIPQESVDIVRKENVMLTVSGRHDTCAVFRAVPVVEAVTALTILDALNETER